MEPQQDLKPARDSIVNESSTIPIYRKYLYPTGLGLALIVAFAIWYYYPSNENNDMRISEKFEEGFKHHAVGEYDQAIAALSDASRDATDPTTRARIDVLLAYNLYFRNQNDDRERAIALYQSIVDDFTVAPQTRAGALTDLAIFAGDMSEATYQRYLGGTPYGPLLTPNPSDRFSTLKASNAILEQVLDIYPRSFVYYSLANNYSTLILNKATGGEPEEAVAQKIQAYIKEGDAIRDEGTYEQSVVLRRLLYRAIGLAVSDRILHNVSLSEREAAYNAALGGDVSTSHQYINLTQMQARFTYAIFLLNNFDPGMRDKDIVEVLKPFAAATKPEPVYAQTRNLFTTLGMAPDSSFSKSQAVKLAAISPEFKTFLESLNWEL